MLERRVRVITAARARPSVIAGSASERRPSQLLHRVHVARDRQPAERDAEQEDQQQGDQEVRHADAEEGERGPEAIERRVAARRGEDADRRGHQQRDGHREARELEARLDAPAHVLDDRLAIADRSAEVALEQAPHPRRVLEVEWPVEAQVAPELSLDAVVHRLRHHRVDRVAGREVDEGKDPGGDEQQHRDRRDQAAENQQAHGGRRGATSARRP
jgi:hypothetical protein